MALDGEIWGSKGSEVSLAPVCAAQHLSALVSDKRHPAYDVLIFENE